MLLQRRILLKLICFIFIIVLFYYCFVTNSFNENNWYVEHTKNVNLSSSINNNFSENFINIWCIFTKVIENVPLQDKFERLIKSLITYSSVPLHIHIISDNSSKIIAKDILKKLIPESKNEVIYTCYDIKECAHQINDIVKTMTPYFSSQPGTYYSDALFYLSLGLHRIASKNQTKAIMLDCDVQFTSDVLLLYKQFDSFQASNLFGLSHELTPVYKHVLYSYRKQNSNTSFGDYVHKKPIITNGNHIYGFPGFNSGVMLFNLSAIRMSNIYRDIISKQNVAKLVNKYKFKGHLGDQDFYTILGYEYPILFKTLPCNFNRQLCVWWRDHGYSDGFSNYFKCEGDIIIYHGNCNTAIPG